MENLSVQVFPQKNTDGNTTDKLERQSSVFLQKISVVSLLLHPAKVQK